MDLQGLIWESDEILLSEFGIKPERSKYTIHLDWSGFVKSTGAHAQSEGVYFPRILSAHLKESSEFLKVNLLHEFYGHGLFCEHAITGKQIVSLEQALAETERKMLNISDLPAMKKFQVDETNSLFREYAKSRKDLECFFAKNVHLYEGFAIWLEHFLSKATNQQHIFEKKMDKLVISDYINLFEHFYNFSLQYGNFALIAQLGFPKYYDKDTVVQTLKKICKEEFDTIDLAILYGSQKPYSDIDLFIVSDSIQSYHNHWLDMYTRNRRQLEEGIKYLSIAVTDPLFSGAVIVGETDFQDQIKRKILDQPITPDAIEYNFAQSEEQGAISFMYPAGSEERKIAQSYHHSFRKNAEQLQKGKKILTFK